MLEARNKSAVMRARVSETMTTHGHTARASGGPKESTTYRSWRHMVERCTNPNVINYDRYGGAGVTVCERWMTFANFLEDMGDRPKRLTLDRIKSDRGYEPGNCRWATVLEQGRNRKCVVPFEYRGELRPLHELTLISGIPEHEIRRRIRVRGWPVEKAVETPLRQYTNA